VPKKWEKIQKKRKKSEKNLEGARMGSNFVDSGQIPPDPTQKNANLRTPGNRPKKWKKVKKNPKKTPSDARLKRIRGDFCTFYFRAHFFALFLHQFGVLRKSFFG
jgi:hypothetical protein